MSTWRRFRRMVRSWFGWAAEMGEDPELILKQNLRDLEAEMPKINEQMAQIAGDRNIAERELQKMRDQEKDLVAKAQASLKAERRDIALSYVTELEKLKPQIVEKERVVESARAGYERMQLSRKTALANFEKKREEIQRALSAKRQADWNERVANTLANFQFAGVDQTHDEMIRKIETQTAKSEAKLQMALEGKQASNVQIEEEAKKIQAEETLRQFELQMGLAKAPVASEPSAAEREKTIGREREKA